MTTQDLIRTVLVYLILLTYAAMSIYLIAGALSGGVNLQSGTPFPYIYKTVLGLISAVVVTELAMTPPKVGGASGSPNFGALLAGGTTRFLRSSDTTRHRLTYATQIYLATWFFVGAATFVFGALIYFSDNTLLSDTGLSWFGLMIGAGYSYFGIQQ